MKIVYTKHAERDKFTYLARHGFKTAKREINNIIIDPDHVDEVSDYPNTIASKQIGTKHVLRVVYKKENDRITVITFYPAQVGRYYNES